MELTHSCKHIIRIIILSCIFAIQTSATKQQTFNKIKTTEIERVQEPTEKITNLLEEIPHLIVYLDIAYAYSFILIRPKQTPLKERFNKTIKRFLVGALLLFGEVFVHETGHAIAAKLCKGRNIRINLGTKRGYESIIELPIGPFTYVIRSPWIKSGETSNHPTEGISNLQKAFIAISGSSSVIATVYAIKVAIYLRRNKYRYYYSQKERVAEALSKALSLDFITFFELKNMLLPMFKGNDGEHFWENILKTNTQPRRSPQKTIPARKNSH